MTIEQMRAVENAQTKYIVNFLAKEIETDNYLAECIANTKLTIKNCMDYIKKEVKKKAIDNMAMVEDSEVYGLAKHFYLEYITFEGKKIQTEYQSKPVKQCQENEKAKKEIVKPVVKEAKPVKKSKEEIKEEALNKLYGGGLFG